MKGKILQIRSTLELLSILKYFREENSELEKSDFHRVSSKDIAILQYCDHSYSIEINHLRIIFLASKPHAVNKNKFKCLGHHFAVPQLSLRKKGRKGEVERVGFKIYSVGLGWSIVSLVKPLTLMQMFKGHLRSQENWRRRNSRIAD